jgi:hypothetical protein
VIRDEEFETSKADAALLARAGRSFFEQETELEVRLPRALADQLVAIWERTGSKEELPLVSPEQRRIRNDASSAALIGEAILEGGRADGDDVVFKVDAWFVGNALSAADDAELLDE